MPPENLPVGPIFPRKPGPFIRAVGAAPEPARQVVVGQWGLIPWFAKEAKLKYSTNNARIEGVLDGTSATFRDPWKRGQRCLIPAASFDEPNLGKRQERMVALSTCRWPRVGLGGSVEHVDGQGHRRGRRQLHDAHHECRYASPDATNAQAGPEARAPRAGQAQRDRNSPRRLRQVAVRTTRRGT